MKQGFVILVILSALAGHHAIAQTPWRTLTHGEDRITSARFLPDGKRLVSADFYGSLILWNVETGIPIWRVNLDGVRSTHSYTISYALAMEVSPDGCTIAVSYDRGRVVNNWLQEGDEYRIGLLDAKDGRELRVLVGSSARALRLAFSPDGRLLASGGPDGTTWLWEVSTGRQVRALKSPRGVSALSFSPNGKLLAVGQAAPNSMRLATEPHLLLFNLESGNPVQKLKVEGSYVNDASFSPNGELLAVAGQVPYEITLLRAGTWQPARSIKNPEVNADRISFSSDGRWLASGQAGIEGGRVFVWESATDANPRTLNFHAGVEAISFSPDATTLAVGTEDGKVILLRL